MEVRTLLGGQDHVDRTGGKGAHDGLRGIERLDDRPAEGASLLMQHAITVLVRVLLCECARGIERHGHGALAGSLVTGRAGEHETHAAAVALDHAGGKTKEVTRDHALALGRARLVEHRGLHIGRGDHGDDATTCIDHEHDGHRMV